MKWFKHFNDTLTGDTMQSILADHKNGAQTVVLFFYILELLSRASNGNEVIIDSKQTGRRLYMTPARIEKNLRTLSERVGAVCTQVVPGSFSFVLPNWLELQASGSKIKTKKRVDKDKDKEQDKEHITEGVCDRPSAPPKKSKPSPKIPTEKTLGSKIWEAYSDAFFSRYKFEPTRNGETNSQAKRLGEKYGEEAIHAAQFYVSHNDAWLVKELHPFAVFAAKPHTYHAQWKTGKSITLTDARKVEQSGSTRSQLERLMGK